MSIFIPKCPLMFWGGGEALLLRAIDALYGFFLFLFALYGFWWRWGGITTASNRCSLWLLFVSFCSLWLLVLKAHSILQTIYAVLVLLFSSLNNENGMG